MTIQHGGGDDLARAIEPVARALLGEPNRQLSDKRDLRFGTHGSLSVDLEKGTWYDHEAEKGGGVLDLIRTKLRIDKPAAVQWLRDRKLANAERPAAKRREVAAYDYHDADGALLFQVVRFEPKDFRQRRPDGRGGWDWKLGRTRRVLYRLLELLAAVEAGKQIFIAEGEKAVDAMRAAGLVATCSPGGAGKWKPEYGAPLRGASVVVLPDNDDAGAAHAAAVAEALAGIAADVRLLPLPGLPPKGDVADWLAAGGTAAELRGLAADALPYRPEAAFGGTGDPPAWQERLLRDDRGQVLPILANAALALREAPELAGLMMFDQMARLRLLRRAVPGSRMEPVAEPRPMTDPDTDALQEWLQRHELRRLGSVVTHQAADLVAHENGFHPVRDYLSSLCWDRTPRIGKWLSYYLGAEPTPYTAAIGRMVLVGLVARVMRPGCKADHMMVLEGPQGVGKSSVCGILGGKWFSDGLPDLAGDQVRVSSYLRGKWLIEVAEMSALGRAETAQLKAFLTRTEERFIPKFGRAELVEPRQCLFVGTTNKEAYLRDETGGRRFWPVRVGAIDLPALAHDRDQLFAEAVAAWRGGEAWWPAADFEREHIAPEQEARFEADAWEQAIDEWLSGRDRCTSLDVARQALFFDTNRLGTADQRRISAALERLGWTQRRDMKGRWWAAPARQHDAT